MEITYDKIGTGYNYTRVADGYISEKVKSLLAPKKNNHYLDIGCGTGNYTKKLSENDFHFWGVDPSIKMFEQIENMKQQNISWVNGFAENFTLPKKVTIDGCIVINTIHHWSDVQKALSNISNIMNSGGRIVIFASLYEQVGNYWLKHYFPDMIEKTRRYRPTSEGLLEKLMNASFDIFHIEKYFIREDLEDLFLNAGRKRPDIYLNESIRNNMHSFPLLCEDIELEIGLKKLKTNIDNGDINKIIDNYDSNEGDYTFIAAVKK